LFAKRHAILPRTVIRTLKDRGLTLAAAESCTGGPTGGSLTKPVGTVYLAISDDAGTDVRHRLFSALDRQLVRSFSAEAALSLIHQRLTA